MHARGDQNALIVAYHKGAQLVSVLAGSAAIVIILFSETFLQPWTQDAELAKRTAPLLSLLMLGNLLNGLMWIPYQAQLAHGWTSLSVRTNIVAVALIVPAVLWATPRYGAEGAAWVWVILNAGYCLIGIHFMYRRILTKEKWAWYTKDVLAPLSIGFILTVSLFSLKVNESRYFNNSVKMAVASIGTLVATILIAQEIRSWIITIIKKFRKTL